MTISFKKLLLILAILSLEVLSNGVMASGPILTINTTSLSPLSVGSSFNQTIDFKINAPNQLKGSYICSASGLPAGLNIDGSTCTISGTPTSSGPYSIEIMACKKGGITCIKTATPFTGNILGAAGNASSAAANVAIASAATGEIPAGVDTVRYRYCMENKLWQGHDAIQYCTGWSTPSSQNTTPPISTHSPFTGLTVGVGAGNSTVKANSGSGSATTGTLALGYAAAVGSASLGSASVIPTIGASISTGIGNQGTAAGPTSSSNYFEEIQPVAPLTKIGAATAITASVGAILSNSVQLTASAGPVFANKTVTNETSSTSSNVLGTRVGVGAAYDLGGGVAIGITATRDNYSGTPVNTFGGVLTFSISELFEQ